MLLGHKKWAKTMKRRIGRPLLMLFGAILAFSVASQTLKPSESVAETAKGTVESVSEIDPAKAARRLVEETRKTWRESYEGDPSLAKQKFAENMKKVDQEFAPVRAMIDKTPESSQKTFALEYFEQMNKLIKEQIAWLEGKIATETNPKWKQELQSHLKDYKTQSPQWGAELQKSKAELQ